MHFPRIANTTHSPIDPDCNNRTKLSPCALVQNVVLSSADVFINVKLNGPNRPLLGPKRRMKKKNETEKHIAEENIPKANSNDGTHTKYSYDEHYAMIEDPFQQQLK